MLIATCCTDEIRERNAFVGETLVTLPKGWEIVGEQHESGQAWVYCVRRVDGGEERFALKRLKNPSRRERFAREVRVISELRKGGVDVVPEVVEADLAGDHPYYVMPWFEGGSLEDSVEDGRYTEDTWGGIRALVAVAKAIQRVHDAGLAHRDIKPSNTLVTKDGEFALGDFGLCLEIDDEAERLTKTEEAVGSRHYIAPENESGMSDLVDQRPADFYAFGKLSYAVLAGRQPPAREGMAEPGWRLEDRLGDQRLEGLTSLLSQLIDTDPRGRLGDWEVVIRELESIGRLFGPQAETVTDAEFRDSATESARRIASLPAVRSRAAELQAEQERSEIQRRQSEWLNKMIDAMHRRAAVIKEELQRLSTESSGAIQLTIAGGTGPSIQELLGKHPSLRPQGLQWEGKSSSSSAPIVFDLRSAIGIDLPVCQLALYILEFSGEIWIFRVPVLQTQAGHPKGIVPEWLVAEYYRADGPLRPHLQQSLERAEILAGEATNLFPRLADRFLALIASELDAFDPSSWF